MKKFSYFVLFNAALISSLFFPLHLLADNEQELVPVRIMWISVLPEESLRMNRAMLAFHSGEVNLFDYGRPIPELTGEWVARGLVPMFSGSAASPEDSVVGAFSAAYPQAKISYIGLSDPDEVTIPPPPNLDTAAFMLDPAKHRFFSYLTMMNPANDLFIANEDPYAVELFDSEGNFRGPIYIDVFGNQVLDAGLCANDEGMLTGMDVLTFSEQFCGSGEGLVNLHPGLNGSYRNPEAEPQRILGGNNSGLGYPPEHPGHRRFDRDNADFSRPGYKISRFIIARNQPGGNWSGSWYDRTRSGEGFNIEIIEPERGSGGAPRMIVYWYTYRPDGSGEQVWLTGMGDINVDGGVAADVDMYYTDGGIFASQSNPDLVERLYWGHIRLGFGRCDEGRVFYFPDDSAWPQGDYFIQRLSPEIDGLGWVCRREDAKLILPDN